MLERIQSDATLPRFASAATTVHRADLVVTPAPVAAEMREKAVAPVGFVRSTSTDVDVVNVSVRAIDGVREGFREIQRTEADQKALEELYAKMLPGYKALRDKMEVAPAVIHEALKAALEVDLFPRRKVGGDAARKVEVQIDDIQISADRERALAKIEAALLKVGALRNKLSEARTSSHEAILNINVSVSGLNMARMQVSDDKVMATLASSACEAIMTNVRSVVVAHGNVSPDLVRLILN